MALTQLPPIGLVKFSSSPNSDSNYKWQEDWQEKISDTLMWPARLYLGKTVAFELKLVDGKQRCTIRTLTPNSNQLLKTIAKVVFAIILVPLAVVDAFFGSLIIPFSNTRAHKSYGTYMHYARNFSDDISKKLAFIENAFHQIRYMPRENWHQTYSDFSKFLNTMSLKYENETSNYEETEQFLTLFVKLAKNYPSKDFLVNEFHAKSLLMNCYNKQGRNEECDELFKQIFEDCKNENFIVQNRKQLLLITVLLKISRYAQKAVNLLGNILDAESGSPTAIRATLHASLLMIRHKKLKEAELLLDKFKKNEHLKNNNFVYEYYEYILCHLNYCSRKKHEVLIKQITNLIDDAQEEAKPSFFIFKAIVHGKNKNLKDSKASINNINDQEYMSFGYRRACEKIQNADEAASDQFWDDIYDEWMGRKDPDFISELDISPLNNILNSDEAI